VTPSVATSKLPENGKSKNDAKRKDDSAMSWTNISDTEGEEKPKLKTKASLKTIVRKKKAAKSIAKDVNKVKQTPSDLLNFVPSKNIQKASQLKVKKKSK